MATAEEVVEAVQTAARAAIIERTSQTSEQLDEAWAPLLAKLRGTLATATQEEARAAVQATMREMAVAAVSPTAAAIRDGAAIGARAAGVQHDRLLSPTGPLRSGAAAGGGDVRNSERQREAAGGRRGRERVSAAAGSGGANGGGSGDGGAGNGSDDEEPGPRRIPPRRAREIAEDRIEGRTTPDRVALSPRLHARFEEAGDEAARVVASSIEAREGLFQAAEQFLGTQRDQINVTLPKYIQEIRDAAHIATDTGDRSVLVKAIRKHRAQMEALGEGTGTPDGISSIRSTVRQFVRDVQMRPEDVEALLARHVEDRAQFLARRIIRHETAEAQRRAYIESTRDQPYVKGYRWRKASSHPRPDVCDVLAAQALYGLGPGGYDIRSVPATPHVSCLCRTEAIVDEHHFRRQRAIRNGTPEPPRPWEDPRIVTGEEWLAEQNEAYQRRLLGPTRASILRDSSDARRVLDRQGRPILVRDVLSGTQSDLGPATMRGREIGVRSANIRDFQRSFMSAMHGNPQRAFVSNHSADELSEMKAIMLDASGRAGVAVKDHGDGRVEATALFNRGGPPHAGVTLLREAIALHGVNYVECYSDGAGGGLELLYSSLGFVADTRTPFADEFAAPDWDYAMHGRPDYVTMRLGNK